ncbi:MAG TPA: proton-conducting transporter membrane subunit [Anaerolineales bacterium]|nr:proton-conducting transporter membrane subunit [Anaerolineales bacterium]HRQ92052.1 proton-conducting transporter membrane subunit [Anaerolineales bacterium]
MLTPFLLLLLLSGPALWLLRPQRWAHGGWLAAFSPALVTGWLLAQLGRVGQGQILTEQRVWSDAFGLALDLRLDGLGLFFGLIVAGIGTAIAVYAGYYFEKNSRLGYFYALLFTFMTSMLGLVWADNLLALFVFWEGTSITSYLLISFKLTDKNALEGARRAFVVTGMGALAMLGGFVLLGQMAGTYSISGLLALPAATLTQHALFTPMLILVLLGAFTKSAQFPFHFWLPGAMAAPTPASAYLHSATMVKAGVYLLARLHPAFAESPLWFWALLVVGGLTMLVGALVALRHYDLKAILAYATVSQLGVLVLLLAFNTKVAVTAAVVGILAHALYKGPLFMVAGIVDHATGTRDIRKLAGLARSLPLVGAAAILAGISMAGIIPTFGFVAKELLLENFFTLIEAGQGQLGWAGLVAVVITGALFVAYSLILLWEAFLRRSSPLKQATVHHAPSAAFVLPVLALTLVGALIPFFFSAIEGALFGSAGSAILGAALEPYLALWHGWTPIFLTSLLAIALGVVIFTQREGIRKLFAKAPEFKGQTVFDGTVDALYRLARWTTRTVQGSSFPTQISIPLLASAGFVAYALSRDFVADLRVDWATIPTFYEVALPLLVVVAALAIARAQSRLSAIISLGLVGSVVMLIYVFFSAPDLALTQFLVEILTLVLLLFVFYRIPHHAYPKQPKPRSFKYLLVSLAVGAWGFGMALLAAGKPLAQTISSYFSLNATAAHGGNIVNVILVDFRGFDTLGEISVMVVAALGGYALLRSSRMRPIPPDKKYKERGDA